VSNTLLRQRKFRCGTPPGTRKFHKNRANTANTTDFAPRHDDGPGKSTGFPVADGPNPVYRTGMNRFLPIVVLMMLAHAGSLPAALHFESTQVEVVAHPDQKEVEAVFRFTNRGQQEARILSVKTGCRCLRAKIEADRLPPGASSSLTGVFKVGNTPGATQRTFQVRVRENGVTRNQDLTVVVGVRELIHLEPRTLTWTAGGAPVEQSIQVTMTGNEPIHLNEVRASGPAFTVRVEEVRKGAQYRLHIKPRDVATPVLGAFQLQTDSRHKKHATPVAFGQVVKR